MAVAEELQDASGIDKNSEYYAFGREYFGPFLYGFTDWLTKKINNKNINKVFFFSRDGFMMKKAYELFSDSGKILCYAYFSRKSLRQALLWKCCDYKDSLKYLTREKYVALGKVLEYYGFSEDEREKLAEDNNWNLVQDYEYISLPDNEFLADIYTKNKELIDARSKEQDDLLQKYLQQIKMTDDCAIVDIGWHGSMQYYLEQFFEQHSMNITLYGYYVGVMPNPDMPLKGEVFGFLYNPDNSSLRKSTLCFFGVYEKLFQSLEGSTYGYENDNDQIIPVLSDYEYKDDADAVSHIKEWQQAALDHIEDKRSKTDILNDEDDLKMALKLVKFGRNPTAEGVRTLSFLYNTDGIKEYYVSRKKLSEYKPKELVHALSNSVWKTGFMKSVFKIPFPYFIIYKILRK